MSEYTAQDIAARIRKLQATQGSWYRMDAEQPTTRYLATWDRKSARHYWQLVNFAPWPKWYSDPAVIDRHIDAGIMRQSIWSHVGLSCELTTDDREPRKPFDPRILPWEGDAGAILDHFDNGNA